MNKFDILIKIFIAIILILVTVLFGILVFRGKSIEKGDEPYVDAEEVWIGEYIQSGMARN